MLAQQGGGYRPAEVRIGREANGRTEVLAGLAPGEKVITSGQFLLDSEASLAGLDVRGIDEASAGASGGDTKQAQRQGPKEYSANGTIEKIARSEEHTSEPQSLMRISYAVFCLKNTTKLKTRNN